MDNKYGKLCPAVQSALYRCERRNKVRENDTRRDRYRSTATLSPIDPMQQIRPSYQSMMQEYHNSRSRWQRDSGYQSDDGSDPKESNIEQRVFVPEYHSVTESRSTSSTASSTSSISSADQHYLKEHVSDTKTSPRPLDKIQRMEQITTEMKLLAPLTTMQWSWSFSKALIDRYKGTAYDFHARGIPMSELDYVPIPTFGKNSHSRMQEMFIATAMDSQRRPLAKMFLKAIPMAEWRRLMELQELYNGEYLADGENVVMEAATLAFLTHVQANIAPRLYGIVRIYSKRGSATLRPSDIYANGRTVTHMCIISEVYGRDLSIYMEQNDFSLSATQKKTLQCRCAKLMSQLHARGLAHLDFTPENILVNGNELRLCDLSRCAPLYTNKLRHLESPNLDSKHRHYRFESCQPNIGKLAFVPPECWKVHDMMSTSRVRWSMIDLAKPIYMNQRNRQCFYYDVAKADVYMLGILMFWIWSDGTLWKYSDPYRCNIYKQLLENDLNLNIFSNCRDWPTSLKTLMRHVLWPFPDNRYGSPENVLDSTWCRGVLE